MSSILLFTRSIIQSNSLGFFLSTKRRQWWYIHSNWQITTNTLCVNSILLIFFCSALGRLDITYRTLDTYCTYIRNAKKSIRCVRSRTMNVMCVLGENILKECKRILSVCRLPFLFCTLSLSLSHSLACALSSLSRFVFLSFTFIVHTPIPYWCAQLSLWEYTVCVTTTRDQQNTELVVVNSNRFPLFSSNIDGYRNGRKIAWIYATVECSDSKIFVTFYPVFSNCCKRRNFFNFKQFSQA